MKKFLTALAFVFIITAIIAPSSAFAVDVATLDELKNAILTDNVSIKLTQNISIDKKEALSILKKKVTIDLNGHTIVNTAGEVVFSVGKEYNASKDIYKKNPIQGGSLTINDSGTGGEIRAEAGYADGFACVGVYGNRITDTTETTTAIDSILTLNSGAIKHTKSYYGIAVYGKGAVANIHGGTIESIGFGITGNGTKESGGTVINITAGTIKGGNNDGAGIYHPQDGTLNISGGTISGADGIQLKAGGATVTNITGGSITGNGEYKDELYDNSNGNVVTGSAISLIGNANYQGKISLSITGPKIELISTNGYAILQSITNKADQIKSVILTNGTYFGTKGALRFNSYETIKDRIAVIGGTYSSDPTTYVKSGYVATKNGDVYIVTSEKKPVEPMLPDNTPVEVADKIIVTSVDMSLKGASKDEAINVAAEKVVTEIITDGGIAQSYLTVNETGKVVAKPELVEKAIKSVTLPKNEVLVTGTITPLPILRAEVSNDKVAAITFEVSAQDLKAKKAGDVKLFKVLSPTKGDFFKFVDTPASVDDTSFALQPSSVDVDNRYFLSADAAIETGKSYRLTMFIKDNGKFDLNKTPGLVADPAELIETKTVTPSSGSSSGCNAGFAALALLAVVPVIYRRKK